MSDSNGYEDEGNDNEGRPDPVRAQLKRVEKERDAYKADAGKATDAIRKLAFIEAGVDINSPAAKWLVKGYDGDLTPDAIRVAAVEAKLIADPSKDPAVEAERAAAVRVAEAGRVNEGAVIPADLASRVDGAKSSAELEQIVALANAGKTP